MGILALTSQEWLAILYLASTCSLLGYFIWFYVMKNSSAAATSSFLFAEPLITVLFAAILIKEEITPFVVGGGLLIFMGVFLITNRRRNKFSPERAWKFNMNTLYPRLDIICGTPNSKIRKDFHSYAPKIDTELRSDLCRSSCSLPSSRSPFWFISLLKLAKNSFKKSTNILQFWNYPDRG